MLTSWRKLRQNPVYLREKGEWGQPNPYYNTIQRYSPFVVLGALVLGFCAGITNPFLLSINDAFLLGCLICLPNLLLSVITWYGAVMAPALTAPTINREINAGSWDMLRVLPYSPRQLILAKLFGALARLRLWPWLLLLSLLQTLLTAGIGLFTLFTSNASRFWFLFTLPATFLRPWLDIFVAALLGLTCSLFIRSTPLSLTTSYISLIFAKGLTGSLLWSGLANLLSPGQEDWLTITILVAPVLSNILLIGLLMLLIDRKLRPQGLDGLRQNHG